jgi:hypothetical protein
MSTGDKRHLRLAGTERPNFLAADNAIDGDQNLDTVADRKNWLPCLMEVSDARLDALVRADGLRPPA